MFSSIILTTLLAVTGAQAAVAEGSWGVRADFSRCESNPPMEAVLEGAPSTKSSPAEGIADFAVTAPFEGRLFLKPAGAVGLGSPYPPQEVDVKVFAEATAGDPGVWANASIVPGYLPGGPVKQILWNTRTDVVVEPCQNKTVSLETIFNGGSLWVYYCGAPEGPLPA